MGLFGQGKEIYVSSTVYNLAGDETKRADFLKTIIVGNVMSDSNASMTEMLSSTYLRGPGIQFRSFGRWARNSGYTAMLGQTTGTAVLVNDLDKDALAALIPKEPDEEVLLQTAEIGVADYVYWADDYMVQNHPTLLGTNYTIGFSEADNEITIFFEGGGSETFTPVGFDKTARYIFASYNLTKAEVEGPVETGPTTTLTSGQNFPSTTGWDNEDINRTPQNMILYRRVRSTSTYSDGRPPEYTDETTSSNFPYSHAVGTWDRTTYQGWRPDGLATWTLKEIMVQTITYVSETATTTNVINTDIGGGVTRTTTITIDQDQPKQIRTWRIDEQELTNKAYGPLKILIYARGSGNPGMDALFGVSQDLGAFLPFVPVRVNNQFITDDGSNLYSMCTKALRKANGASFSDLIDKISDNEQLNDIDYAYVVFGVSLNVKENACKRYIYEFFQEVMLGQDLSGNSYDTWRAQRLAAEATNADWRDWLDDQVNQGPRFGEVPEPVRVPYPSPPNSFVHISTPGVPVMAYDMHISWNGIAETVGTGLKKPDAKPGELWFEATGFENFEQSTYFSGDGSGSGEEIGVLVVPSIRLNWQVTANSWRSLDIQGLYHRNGIYGGKYVGISGYDAILDTEESGFIIPLHEEIYKRMPLTEATQMSTACSFVVFNSFTIVKERWYQTDWFKIVLVIVVIIVTVITMGAGSAAGAGLLGTNAAVGASLGLTGTAALVAGAIANALAAMIVAQIITYGAKALFGDKVGAIIGAVFSMAAITVGSSLMNGGSLSAGFGELMKAENLLKLTIAAGQGYAEYVQASVQDILNKTQDIITDYNTRSTEIATQYEQILGMMGGMIDPLAFIDSPQIGPMETPTSFLSRTLLTGGDVAEMSMGMLSEFASITLSKDLML